MIEEIQSTKNPQELTVTELSRALKNTIEDKFSFVRVKGEISGLKNAPSGHVYFNLKDSESLIAAVCWKGIASASTVKLEEGLEVILSGKISIYPGRSTYQIIVSSFEASGQGALLALLEKRKKAFQDEGLFDVSKKKPIPRFPNTIAIITSPTGAVIRDMLHRISERFPTHVVIYPTNVQGEGAAEGVADAIKMINNTPPHMPKPDVIIVARGGGSVEDLWAFNEDIVVRAAYASQIPLISAIGHETDFTLLDFVADKRAPTPTAAAEMATPVISELRRSLDMTTRILSSSLPNLFNTLERKVVNASISLLNFSQKVSDLEYNIGNVSDKLSSALRSLIQIKEHKFLGVSSRLTPSHIERKMQLLSERYATLNKALNTAYTTILHNTEQKLEGYGRLLSSLNYKKVLERGFSVARSNDGKIIKHSTEAATAFSFQLEFADGNVEVMPKVKMAKANNSSGQGNLF